MSIDIDIDKLEALANRVNLWGQAPTILELIALLRAAEAREQALAAHVERLFNKWDELTEEGTTHDELTDAMDEIFGSAATTPLDHLKAEAAAEALEALSRAKRPNGSPPEGDSFTAGWDAAFESMDSEAARYRRQAQEGQP